MGRAEMIAEVEREIVKAEDRLAEARAHLAGLRTQLEVLRRSVAPVESLAELSRTEAIEAVLQDAPAGMTPTAVFEALVAGGRSAEVQKNVTATLSYLKTSGRVVQPRRGVYELA